MIAREDSTKTRWRIPGVVLVAVAFGLAVSVAGCGGASSAGRVTSVIDLKSPGIGADGATRPNVHCGWGAIWLPLEWDGVPEDAKELAIFIERFKDGKDGSGRVAVPYADLVSQIKPSLQKLGANELPEGIAWSNFGPTSCPPIAKGQRVLVEIFAFDRREAERQLTRPLAIRLTEEALAEPHPSAGPRSAGALTSDMTAVGRLFTNYPGQH